MSGNTDNLHFAILADIWDKIGEHLVAFKQRPPQAWQEIAGIMLHPDVFRVFKKVAKMGTEIEPPMSVGGEFRIFGYPVIQGMRWRGDSFPPNFVWKFIGPWAVLNKADWDALYQAHEAEHERIMAALREQKRKEASKDA